VPLKKPISMTSQIKSTPAAMTAMTAMVFKGSLCPSGCVSVKKPRPTATMMERYIAAIHQPVRSRSCRRLTLSARLTLDAQREIDPQIGKGHREDGDR
jgi:hypothetical protein